MTLRVLWPCGLMLLSTIFATAQDVGTDRWYSKKTSWNGFDQFHFQVADRNAYLVVPDDPRKGAPWIWRARFPGFHAEMDVELVRRGFHLGYVDVAGLYGSPKAIEIGDQFYARMTEQIGLNRKVVLEGVSRGGLFVYNWAAKHTELVSCIYCDTPVCDFRSWPQGAGKGIGSQNDWKRCLEAYELSPQQVPDFVGVPIDHAPVIARAKLPILHIVSENDQVVPPNENTYELRDRLQKLGHSMEIMSVPMGTEKSNGHHFTHPDPKRVVNFILKHASDQP